MWLMLLMQLAGTGGIGYGPSLPASCAPGDVFAASTSPALSICTAMNTWTTLPTSAGGVPSGTIVLIAAGTCPTGYSEATALNGVMLRGTLAANGNVGTSGGSDTITPTGSNSAPLFTGASGTVPAELFTGSSATSSAVSAGTPTGTNATVSFTPTGTNGASATSGNCAATNIAAGTGSATACKATAPNLTVSAQTFTGASGTVPAEVFTGSALGTHTHALTATGTNGTVSFTPTGTVAAPSFTGVQFDNRPSYLNVIFCKRD